MRGGRKSASSRRMKGAGSNLASAGGTSSRGARSTILELVEEDRYGTRSGGTEEEEEEFKLRVYNREKGDEIRDEKIEIIHRGKNSCVLN